jgi:hypothetical protein
MRLLSFGVGMTKCTGMLMVEAVLKVFINYLIISSHVSQQESTAYF